MTFSAVGTIIQSQATTFSLTPHTAGDFILFEVTGNSTSSVPSSMASTNVTWKKLGTAGTTDSGSPFNPSTAQVFFGTVTAASAATVTIAWTGTTPSLIQCAGQEFHSTVGASSVTLDVQATLNSDAGTNTWPSLTPGHGSGELYFGYALDNSSAVNGSTSGYTYQSDSNSNGMAYNPACGATATAPVWGDSLQIWGVMVLAYEASGSSSAPFFPFRQAVRARTAVGAPFSGRAAAELGPGTGNISGPVGAHGAAMGANGAPVRNPSQGPVFRPAVRACRAQLPGQMFSAPRGRVSSSPGAPVRNPSQGPVFTQKPAPVRYALPPWRPRAGRIGSSFGIPVITPATGPPFRPAVQAVRAKIPPQPYPRRGQCRSVRPLTVFAPPSPGPAFYPAVRPARAVIPQDAPRGRVSGSPGGPVVNPAQGTGPVFFPRRDPARTRPSLPGRGRIASSQGVPVRNPVPGPVFRPAVQAVRARLPLQPLLRGRSASNAGAPVRNPSSGPAVYAPQGPARSRTQPPFSKGRISGNAGAAVQNPLPGPVFYPVVRPVRAPVPQVFSKGRSSGNAGAPLRNPSQGPVFAQAVTPARARTPLPPRGRIASNPGAPVQNPPPVVTGPPFFPFRSPVRVHPVLPPRGRIASGPGAPLRNPSAGPVFRQAAEPARARIPQIFSKGRASGNPGAAVYSGPPFRQATAPARIRLSLPPRGRVASNAGGPVQNPPPPILGPVFRQATSPARIRQALPPRGRIASSAGAPVRNPSQGPVFLAAVRPVRAPVPQVFSKGRTEGNQGTPAPAVAPVYPWHGPVRIRPALPPRGRASGSPGIPVKAPPVPAPVYPLHGPVQARRPLPPHGRVITGNPGGLVSNPRQGPVFRPLDWPARARIPQNAPRGRTSGNPGGPVANIPSGTLALTYGEPYFEWAYGTPYFEWEYGDPHFEWETGTPYTS